MATTKARYLSAAAILDELKTDHEACRASVLAGNLRAANAAAKRMADRLNGLSLNEAEAVDALCDARGVPSKSPIRPFMEIAA